jgi:hypothetical protein
MSLVDPTQGYLPAGHPFQQVVPPGIYWLASTSSTTTPPPGDGFVAFIVGGFMGIAGRAGQNAGAWCVRGGSHVLTNVAQ